MRLIADENVPKRMVEALRAHGNDVLWARTDCSGWNDAALMDFAESEARIMLTLDEDVWQTAFQRQTPFEQSGVVLFRVHPPIPENLTPLVRAFVDADKPRAGHLSIIADDEIQKLAAGRR